MLDIQDEIKCRDEKILVWLFSWADIDSELRYVWPLKRQIRVLPASKLAITSKTQLLGPLHAHCRFINAYLLWKLSDAAFICVLLS
jgi:hypothetical protein